MKLQQLSDGYWQLYDKDRIYKILDLEDLLRFFLERIEQLELNQSKKDWRCPKCGCVNHNSVPYVNCIECSLRKKG